MSDQTYTKFGFDTEFFELVQGQKVGLPAGAVASSSPQAKAHLEEARQQGEEEGYARGLAEGQQQAQADLAQVQQHLQNTLLALQKAQDDREEMLLAQTLTLLKVTVAHLAGHAARHYAPELLEHHLRAVLPLLKAEEALTLRVHPSARGYHEKLGLPQASIMGLPMHVKSDPSLGPTDAVVEWTGGGVESKLAAHVQAVQALLSGAGADDVPEDVLKPDLSPAPQAAPAPASVPEVPIAPPASKDPSAAPADADLETAAAKAARERARQLLGDDDDLVDALK